MKSPFKLWGLNFCLKYFPILSLPLPPSHRQLPSTTGSAPSCSPPHFPLGVRPLNHLNHLGLLRELNGRRHILSTTTPDTAACQTLSLLEGTREVGWKEKNPDIPEMGFRSITEMVFHTFWTLHRAKKGCLGIWWLFSAVFTPDSLWQLRKFFQCKGLY